MGKKKLAVLKHETKYSKAVAARKRILEKYPNAIVTTNRDRYYINNNGKILGIGKTNDDAWLNAVYAV